MFGGFASKPIRGWRCLFQKDFCYEFRGIGADSVCWQVIWFIAGEPWQSVVAEKMGRPLHSVHPCEPSCLQYFRNYQLVGLRGLQDNTSSSRHWGWECI